MAESLRRPLLRRTTGRPPSPPGSPAKLLLRVRSPPRSLADPTRVAARVACQTRLCQSCAPPGSSPPGSSAVPGKVACQARFGSARAVPRQGRPPSPPESPAKLLLRVPERRSPPGSLADPARVARRPRQGRPPSLPGSPAKLLLRVRSPPRSLADPTRVAARVACQTRFGSARAVVRPPRQSGLPSSFWECQSCAPPGSSAVQSPAKLLLRVPERRSPPGSLAGPARVARRPRQAVIRLRALDRCLFCSSTCLSGALTSAAGRGTVCRALKRFSAGGSEATTIFDLAMQRLELWAPEHAAGLRSRASKRRNEAAPSATVAARASEAPKRRVRPLKDTSPRVGRAQTWALAELQDLERRAAAQMTAADAAVTAVDEKLAFTQNLPREVRALVEEYSGVDDIAADIVLPRATRAGGPGALLVAEGTKFEGFEFKTLGLGQFRVSGLGCSVSGLRFKLLGFWIQALWLF